MILLLLAFLSPFQLELAFANHEDSCGIYPPCSDEGTFQILEDCKKYIVCERNANGGFDQVNMECPGDLFYAEEYGECVEWDKATECKNFQNSPCFIQQCPRFYIESTGYGLEYQEFRIGCFRLSGEFGGGMAYYKSAFNGQFLTPDQFSTPSRLSWIIGESIGALNGGIRNKLYNFVHCPFSGWNDGWEVDKGLGHWVVDNTITTTCFKGDEGGPTGAPTGTPATTNAPPTSASMTTTTTTMTTATYPENECKVDGPNKVGDCMSEFNCCRSLSGTNWEVTHCRCLNGLVFDEDFNFCNYPDGVDGCGLEDGNPRNASVKISYECDGGKTCPGI